MKETGTSEIKPSFSLRYFALTFLSTVIVAAAGLGITRVFTSKIDKTITIFEDQTTNLFSGVQLPNSQFEANYYLKNNDGSREEIHSLFRARSIVKNDGNEGIENLEITVALDNAEATLNNTPIINTEPKELTSAIALKLQNENSTNSKHKWTVSLLNPGESISFEYTIYSNSKLSNINCTITPRKKDWKTNRRSLIDTENEKELDITSIAVGIVFAVLLTPVLILLSAIPLYAFVWILREDYRLHYRNLIDFYWNHSPKNLFENKENSAFRFKQELADKIVKKEETQQSQ